MDFLSRCRKHSVFESVPWLMNERAKVQQQLFSPCDTVAMRASRRCSPVACSCPCCRTLMCKSARDWLLLSPCCRTSLTCCLASCTLDLSAFCCRLDCRPSTCSDTAAKRPTKVPAQPDIITQQHSMRGMHVPILSSLHCQHCKRYQTRDDSARAFGPCHAAAQRAYQTV